MGWRDVASIRARSLTLTFPPMPADVAVMDVGQGHLLKLDWVSDKHLFAAQRNRHGKFFVCVPGDGSGGGGF
jgi:hypothetical protein